MPALYRAIPVVEVDDVAVLVTHDLNFDMPRVVDKPAPRIIKLTVLHAAEHKLMLCQKIWIF